MIMWTNIMTSRGINHWFYFYQQNFLIFEAIELKKTFQFSWKFYWMYWSKEFSWKETLFYHQASSLIKRNQKRNYIIILIWLEFQVLVWYDIISNSNMMVSLKNLILKIGSSSHTLTHTTYTNSHTHTNNNFNNISRVKVTLNVPLMCSFFSVGQLLSMQIQVLRLLINSI